MFFDQGVFAMKGDGVKIQIKGATTLKTKLAHGIEPKPEYFRVAGRINPAAVLGKKSPLWRAVEPGEESKTLVQHIAHDMAVPGIAEKFQGQQRPHCMAGRDHFTAGKTCVGQQSVEGNPCKIRKKEKEPTKTGSESARREIQPVYIGDRRFLGTYARRSLFVPTARQSRESLFLEDYRDGGWAQDFATIFESSAYIVNGKVLFAQTDDLVLEPIHFGSRLRSFGGWLKEFSLRIFSKVMTQDTKTSWTVSKTFCCFGTGEAFDEVGAKCLVLSVCRIGWFQESFC
jgi:hypothetical protein